MYGLAVLTLSKIVRAAAGESKGGGPQRQGGAEGEGLRDQGIEGLSGIGERGSGIEGSRFGGVAVGEVADDFDGFEAEADDLADEADDVFGVVGVVGVGADGGALVLLDAVLVDDPSRALRLPRRLTAAWCLGIVRTCLKAAANVCIGADLAHLRRTCITFFRRVRP